MENVSWSRVGIGAARLREASAEHSYYDQFCQRSQPGHGSIVSLGADPGTTKAAHDEALYPKRGDGRRVGLDRGSGTNRHDVPHQHAAEHRHALRTALHTTRFVLDEELSAATVRCLH